MTFVADSIIDRLILIATDDDKMRALLPKHWTSELIIENPAPVHFSLHNTDVFVAVSNVEPVADNDAVIYAAAYRGNEQLDTYTHRFTNTGPVGIVSGIIDLLRHIRDEFDPVKPITRASIHEDYDYKHSLIAFDAKLHTIPRILRSLGIYWHDSRARASEKRLRYKANGTWNRWRDEEGRLCIEVSVGCHCEHDCCGHLCGLVYKLYQSPDDGITFVEVFQTFNY